MSNETNMAKDASEQQRLMLHYAADVRKFEIQLFWQRSLFFWGFLAAAMVAYANLRSDDEAAMRTVVACFGFVCSIAWTLQNRGSKYWQEAWEQKVKRAQIDVLDGNLFSKTEPRLKNGFWGAWRFSVSGLTIALSDFAAVVWSALLYSSCTGFKISDRPDVVGWMVVLSALYAVIAGYFNFRKTPSIKK
jgi:hypothetical protein